MRIVLDAGSASNNERRLLFDTAAYFFYINMYLFPLFICLKNTSGALIPLFFYPHSSFALRLNTPLAQEENIDDNLRKVIKRLDNNSKRNLLEQLSSLGGSAKLMPINEKEDSVDSSLPNDFGRRSDQPKVRSTAGRNGNASKSQQ